MNYGQINTEVGQSMTSDDPARVKIWVNAAYDEILARDDWSFLEVSSAAVALVASQQAYELIGASPVVPDFGGIIDVRLEVTSGGVKVPMENMEVRDFDRWSDRAPGNLVPVMYTIVGGAPPSAGSANILSGAKQDLLVWPRPLATAGNGVNLFLRYFRSTSSVQMAADSDVPIIPVQHHYAIVELAKSIALADDDQVQQSQQFRQMAEARIAAMQIEDSRMRTGDRFVWSMMPQQISRAIAQQPQPEGK